MIKTQKRGLSALAASVMILALALSGCGKSANTSTSGFAGGSGTANDP